MTNFARTPSARTGRKPGRSGASIETRTVLGWDGPKNSSLAVAIGYPDVVSIANTSLNQTGRAVEAIAIVMLVYLTTSLSTSLFMNWYNARSAIKER